MNFKTTFPNLKKKKALPKCNILLWISEFSSFDHGHVCLRGFDVVVGFLFNFFCLYMKMVTFWNTQNNFEEDIIWEIDQEIKFTVNWSKFIMVINIQFFQIL